MYVTAHVIPMHARIQPPLHLMRFNKSCSWQVVLFLYSGLIVLNCYMQSRAISEVNSAVTKQLDGNRLK